MIVTIDGPAGSGKSTVARRLAEELGFQFLDSGAMYRMVALKTLQTQIDSTNHAALIALIHSTSTDLSEGGYVMDGADVSQEIRTPEVTRLASFVAQIPDVRELLVQRQRDFASSRNIVCEGRDQGTVAFPHAECKFYLTATAEVRARRRLMELQSQGKPAIFEEVVRDQTARDRRDEEREASPLRPAADAVIVDTTDLSMDEVIEVLRNQIRIRQQSLQAQ